MRAVRKVFNDPEDEVVFRKQGFLTKKVLSSDDLMQLQDLFDSVEHEHVWGEYGEIFATIQSTNLDMRQLVADRMSEILKHNVLPLLNDYEPVIGNFFLKRANKETKKLDLHQDKSVVGDEDFGPGLVIWCPLKSVTADNGGLGFIPNSQLLNNNYRSFLVESYPDMSSYDFLEKYITYLDMQAGEIVVFDYRIFHGSKPNISDEDRVAASIIVKPAESATTYCHVDVDNALDVLEVYEVHDNFYPTYEPDHFQADLNRMRSKSKLIDRVPFKEEKLDEEKFKACTENTLI